jgi:hypothetical protein
MPELRQNFFTKEWVINRHRARPTPRVIGYTSGRPKRSVVFGNLPILPGQRK